MKKVNANWFEEVIDGEVCRSVEAECPYCNNHLTTQEIINTRTIVGRDNIDHKVFCHGCQKIFLLDIFE